MPGPPRLHLPRGPTVGLGTLHVRLRGQARPPARVGVERIPTEVREALNFDREQEKTKQDSLMSMFNDEQMEVFTEINDSVMKNEGKCFHLKGAGGCGKTTLATALLHAARARGDIAIACDSSGIAATLLPKGQTAHSAFKIPVEGLDPDSTCNAAY